MCRLVATTVAGRVDLLPTDAKSGNPRYSGRRYSARRAIALWIIISASIWLVVGAFMASLFEQHGDSLDADADRLSKILPAAGAPAAKP
jgi:hypothetical protein